MAEASLAEGTIDRAGERVGRFRWVIVALLFAATAINYIDRQMIGVLKPTLSQEFGWSEGDFAQIVFWFQLAYAVGYISFQDDMDLAIAIRTAVLRNGVLYVQVGAGIVHDSVPAAEWQETLNKARAVLRAAELVQLGLDTEL